MSPDTTPSDPPPPPRGETAKITCYSAGEGGFMDGSQSRRGRWLEPLLRLLAAAGVRANHLTVLSLAMGLAFCPALWMGWPEAAMACLLAHVLLDGLDGPLARHLGQAGNRGSFTDTISDQIVVTFTTLCMIHEGHAGPWPAGLYIFFYCMVVVFAMVRNALAIPYAWLVRPRFLVYLWFPLELWWWQGSLDALLWLMSALLALKMLTGFIRIRRQL